MQRSITGYSNPAVKYLRSLRDKKQRRRAGQFLVEGLRLLEDARSTGRVPQMLVMAEAAARTAASDALLARLQSAVVAAGGEVIITTPDILAKITGKDNPQTVAGVFDVWDTGLGQLDRSRAPIWLVAQALRDPGNLGTMLRTCDAVGAGGLILIDDCADPFSAEAVRASMGAVFTVGLAQARWEEFLPWLRGPDGSAPGQLVAASLRDAVPYRAADYRAPCFILVGNESRGLPDEYEVACDLRVTMPMKGRADSLNAAVAGAVLAYEVLAAVEG
jgi:TrmH family RNA methyltransferase